MPVSVQRLLELGRVATVVPSPSGAFLVAAVAHVDPETARFVSKLVRVPLDGSAPTELTRGKSNDRAPAFRGDGTVGFLSNREGDRADSLRGAPAQRRPERARRLSGREPLDPEAAQRDRLVRARPPLPRRTPALTSGPRHRP